jgi:glutamate dehydrogenase (NADP+)
MKHANVEGFLDYVKDRNPAQPEFHQAVCEVIESPLAVHTAASEICEP